MARTTDPGSAFLAPSIEARVLRCPSCGAELAAPHYASPDLTVNTLLAVCDVLVVKALEKMGNYIVRAERRRHNAIGDEPYYLAHLYWPATDEIVTKALRGAWDVVPLLLDTHGPYEFDSKVAVEVLDQYVHDLAVSGTRHDFNALAYRIREGLGLPVFHVQSGAVLPRATA